MVFICDNKDFDNPANGLFEIELHMDDWCYGSPLNENCFLPKKVRTKIDEILDDGINTTGNIQRFPDPDAYDTISYITVWDFR